VGVATADSRHGEPIGRACRDRCRKRAPPHWRRGRSRDRVRPWPSLTTSRSTLTVEASPKSLSARPARGARRRGRQPDRPRRSTSRTPRPRPAAHPPGSESVEAWRGQAVDPQTRVGRWQIRYRTRDGVSVAWPETYARRADAVRVLAELERQSQVLATGWMSPAARFCSPLTPIKGSTSTRASGRVQSTSTARSFAGTSPQPWGRYHSVSSTQPLCVSGAPGCSKAWFPRPWSPSRTTCSARS